MEKNNQYLVKINAVINAPASHVRPARSILQKKSSMISARTAIASARYPSKFLRLLTSLIITKHKNPITTCNSKPKAKEDTYKISTSRYEFNEQAL